MRRLIAILILLVVARAGYGFWRYFTAPLSFEALLDEPPALAPRTESTTTVVPPKDEVEQIRQRVREGTRGFCPTVVRSPALLARSVARSARATATSRCSPP